MAEGPFVQSDVAFSAERMRMGEWVVMKSREEAGEKRSSWAERRLLLRFGVVLKVGSKGMERQPIWQVILLVKAWRY